MVREQVSAGTLVQIGDKVAKAKKPLRPRIPSAYCGGPDSPPALEGTYDDTGRDY